MKRTNLNAAFLIVSLALGSVVRAESIVDGGLEAPQIAAGTYITLFAGDPKLGPWVVSLTSVDLLSTNGGGLIGPAYEGQQFIDLDGTPGPGELTQSFSTIPGQTYEFSFAYANNYAAGSGSSASVSVLDSSGYLLGPTTISHNSSGPGDLKWVLFTGAFTADQSSASVDFRSLDGFSFGGVLLDGVSIASVPEPSSILLIGIGVSGLLGFLQLRKRIASVKCLARPKATLSIAFPCAV